MQISVGNMSKRVNSTKQTFNILNTFDVKLKEKTSIMNPVFILDKSYDENVNYLSCKWGYYWIIDVVHVTATIVEIYAKRDYLATHKTWIGYSKGWFSLGEEAYWNKYIDDSRFAPEIEFWSGVQKLDASSTAFSSGEVNSPWKGIEQGGTYIVRTQATAGGSSGSGYAGSSETGVCTYIGGLNFLKAIYKNLYAAVNQEIPNNSTIDETLAKQAKGFSVTDISNQIKSIYYVPFAVSTVGNAIGGAQATEFCIGPFALDLGSGITYYEAREVSGVKTLTSNGTVWAEQDVTIPDDQDLHTKLPWLKASKYFKVSLTHPFGSMDISSDSFVDNSKITIKEGVNFLTGEVAIQVFINNGLNAGGTYKLIPLGSASGCVGCDMSGIISVGLNSAKGFNKAGRTTAVAGITGAVAGAVKGAAVGGLAGAVAGAAIGGTVGLLGAKKNNDAKTAARTPSGGDTQVTGSVGMVTAPERTAPFRVFVEAWKPAMIENFNNDYSPYCNLYGWPTRKYGQLDTIGAGTNGSYVQGIDVDIGTAYANATDPQPTIEEMNSINEIINSGMVFE